MTKETPHDQKPQTVEEQLTTIIEYLHRSERRDRERMIGGVIRTIISMIPILLTLYFAWYFYNHSAEFIQEIQDAMKDSINPFGN